MAKKLTYEEVKEYIESQGYKLLSKEYKGCKTKLKVVCPEGHLWEATWDNFHNQGHRCKTCATNKRADNDRFTYEYVNEEFNKKGYILISKEYVNTNTKLQTICPNGHDWETTFSNFHNCGGRCPKCSGRKPTYKTCIATTDPWMMKFLKNKEDGYKYSHGSTKKVEVICPYCGKEKKIRVNHIYNCKGICCPNCGDGVSFNEKILISVLNQLKVVYIKEYSPKWIGQKRYDFYLPCNNIIIETHGEQHYKYTGRGRPLEEEQINDKYKKELALQNGIDYIILDCRKSELNYIKQSILNSKLSEIFDLSKIDWLKCESEASSNLVKQVCDYWYLHNEINHEELSTTDIGKVFNLERGTICRYLKRGIVLGWCTTYSPKFEQLKGASKAGKSLVKPVEIFKDNKSLGIFKSISELETQSKKLFGVKLLITGISQVCHGKLNHYKGYTFRYITKEEYESKIS